MAIGNLQQIIPAFFTGPNGEPLTPDQIAQRQQVAQSLLQQATDTSPNAGGWASVLAKGLQGGIAGYQQGRADDAAALNAKTDQANIEAGLGSIFGGGIAPVGGVGGAFPSAVAQGASPTSGVATGTSSPPQLTPLAEGSEWLQYANQGATRNLPINELLSSALSFLPEMGVTMRVVSGGQVGKGEKGGRVGSTRHDHGNAADVDFYIGDRKLTPKNEQDRAILAQIVQRGKAAGITGWGEGDDYMGSGRVHLGFGAPGVWGAGGKAANAPEWLTNAYNTPYTPQQAIQAIAPIEQGDENPAAGIAPIAQAGNAYIDPIVAPVSDLAEPVFNQDNFSSRFGESQPLSAPIVEPPMQPQQQPQIDPRLAAINDQMLGGALSPTGRSEVAQALTGYFPDAPSANRAPIPAQNNAMTQAPIQQQAGGVNPQIIASLLGPNSSPQARQVGALLIGHHQQQQDPMRQLQIQKMQAEVDQLNRGLPSANSSFGNLDAQARAAGLQPGTPEYQQFMLNGGGAPATFRALDMQAQAAGFQPGTPEYNEFMATRGAGLSAGAAQEAKNQADISSGGTAAGAIDLGKATIKAGVDAWSDYGKLQTSIGNIEESIRALDSGAKSGAVYKMLPNVTEASASLQNAMDRMGLDVIGSVTFGALSEGEMRLAMNTAVPRDLAPAELRSWLVRKLEAQKKASAMLADAARYLTVPGNTINGWIEKNLAEKSQSESQQPSQSGGGWSDAGDGVRIRPRGGN